MEPLDPFLWREQRHFALWMLLSGAALFIILAWAPFAWALAGFVVWLLAVGTLARYYDRECMAARAYLARRAAEGKGADVHGYASWNEVVGRALEEPELNDFVRGKELDS